MGRTHPDTVRSRPTPLQAPTIGMMAAAGWKARASCSRCDLKLHVDLAALAKLLGPNAILWGRTPRCRRWIDHGDGRCKGRVTLDTCAIVGGTWTSISDAHQRMAAENALALWRSFSASTPKVSGGGG